MLKASSQPWQNYRTTVASIENTTGLDLFPLVPTSVQESIESVVDGALIQ